MTRIEKATQEIINEYTRTNCPSAIFNNIEDRIYFDYNTVIKDENDNIIGCRGITCVECWNKEYIERYGKIIEKSSICSRSSTKKSGTIKYTRRQKSY